jgi:hypothetical protein
VRKTSSSEMEATTHRTDEMSMCVDVRRLRARHRQPVSSSGEHDASVERDAVWLMLSEGVVRVGSWDRERCARRSRRQDLSHRAWASVFLGPVL